jgi:hypothetical protein
VESQIAGFGHGEALCTDASRRIADAVDVFA